MLRLITTTLLLASLFAFVASDCACALEYKSNPTGTQGMDNHQKKNHQGAPVSVTTGFHEISGWEKQVIKRDENLRHWNWIPMLEADKAYIRLKPGKDTLPGAINYPKRPRRYPKPNPYNLPRRGTVSKKTPAHVINTAHRPGIYNSPQHVATNLTPKLRVPYINMKYAVPKTEAKLATSDTAAKLRSKDTSARLSANNVNAKLRHEDVTGTLATRNTGAALRTNDDSTDAFGELLPQKADPNVRTYNCKPELINRKSGDYSTNQNVFGKLVKKQKVKPLIYSQPKKKAAASPKVWTY